MEFCIVEIIYLIIYTLLQLTCSMCGSTLWGRPLPTPIPSSILPALSSNFEIDHLYIPRQLSLLAKAVRVQHADVENPRHVRGPLSTSTNTTNALPEITIANLFDFGRSFLVAFFSYRRPSYRCVLATSFLTTVVLTAVHSAADNIQNNENHMKVE